MNKEIESLSMSDAIARIIREFPNLKEHFVEVNYWDFPDTQNRFEYSDTEWWFIDTDNGGEADEVFLWLQMFLDCETNEPRFHVHQLHEIDALRLTREDPRALIVPVMTKDGRPIKYYSKEQLVEKGWMG